MLWGEVGKEEHPKHRAEAEQDECQLEWRQVAEISFRCAAKSVPNGTSQHEDATKDTKIGCPSFVSTEHSHKAIGAELETTAGTEEIEQLCGLDDPHSSGATDRLCIDLCQIAQRGPKCLLKHGSFGTEPANEPS